MSSSVGAVAQLGTAVLGGVIGGPLGYSVGNLVGSLLFGPKPHDTAALQKLQVETSEYGVFIKEFYGSMLTSGNIIDCRYKNGKPSGITTKKKKISPKGGTGAGAPATETEIIEYYLTAAYLLGRGPLDVDKIWMEDDGEKKLIYNRYGETRKKRGYDLTPQLDIFGNVVAELSDKVQLYRGLESQPVNPILEEFHPDGVPSYHGTAYVLFNKLKVKSVPSFSFLVRNNITGRKEIVQHRLERCGIPSDRIDLSQLSGSVCGAVVAQREGAAQLCESIAITSLCDMAFVDGLITDRNRQAPLFWPLVQEEMAAFEADENGASDNAPDPYKVSTINETDLPSRFKVQFQNTELDYADDSAPADRNTATHFNEQSITLPISGQYEDMVVLSKVLIDELWAAKDSAELPLLPHRIKASPGDVYELPEDSRYKYLRIGDQQIGPDGLLYHKATSYDPGVYGQYPVSYTPPHPPSEVDVYEEPQIVISDTVALHDEMAAGPGFLSGVSVSAESAFDGAQLQSDELGNVDYGFKAIIGKTLTPYYFLEEETTRINYDKSIRLRLVDGELSSTTEELLRNKKANTILIGNLSLQFMEAEQVDDNEWLITGLLPGRDGSDYVNSSPPNSPVMVITDDAGALDQGVVWTPLPYSALNSSHEYSVVMNSPNGEFTGPLSFTPSGNSVKTLSPVHIRLIERVAGVHVKIGFSPRTRLNPNASWAMTNESDPTLFRVELSGGLVKTVSDNEVVFTEAELIAQYGFVPASLSGKIQGKNNLTGLGFIRNFEGL
jgi:hypothetical protein